MKLKTKNEAGEEIETDVSDYNTAGVILGQQARIEKLEKENAGLNKLLDDVQATLTKMATDSRGLFQPTSEEMGQEIQPWARVKSLAWVIKQLSLVLASYAVIFCGAVRLGFDLWQGVTLLVGGWGMLGLSVSDYQKQADKIKVELSKNSC